MISRKKFIQKSLGGFNNVFTRRSDKDLSKAHSESVWAYAASQKIAEAVASGRLKLMRRVGDETAEVFNHPALDLLKYPNREMQLPQFSLFELLVLHMEYTGDAYWRIVGNHTIVPLMPSNIEIVKSADSFIKEYKYSTDTGEITIPREEIVHFRKMNPVDLVNGQGTMTVVDTADQVDREADRHNATLLKNNGVPPVIIKGKGVDDDPDDEALEENPDAKGLWTQFVEGWKKKFGSGKKTDPVGFLNTDQELEILQLGLSNQDMAFSDLTKDAKAKILAAFGVPVELLGQLGNSNLASAKVAEYLFAKYTVKSRMRRISDTLNYCFLPLFKGKTDVYFEFADPTPSDQEFKLKKRESDSKIGVRTINEMRAEDGLDPVEGGDVIRLPFNLTSIAEPKTEETPKKDEEKTVKKKFNVKSADIIKKTYLKRYDKLENKFLKKIQPLLNEQKKDILEKLSKKFEDSKNYSDDLNINKSAATKKFFSQFEKLFLALAIEEGKAAFVELGWEADFDFQIPAFSELVKTRTQKFAQVVNESTFDHLKTVMSEGFENGESEVEISRRVKLVFEGSDKDKARRAKTIARTETGAALSEGRHEAYKQAGVKKVKWLSADDARTRPTHHAAGQQDAVDFGVGKFQVGSDEMKWPKDVTASAGNVINCRCRTIPEIE